MRLLDSLVFLSRSTLTPDQRREFSELMHDAADAIGLVKRPPEIIAMDFDVRGYPVDPLHHWNYQR